MIRTFGYFHPPTSWVDVLKRTLDGIDEDNCLGLAAQLAFYFLLALFPALLFLVALVGYLPLTDVLAELLAGLGAVAPPQLVQLLRDQLEQIAAGGQAGLLTLGIVGALWSSSAAMVAIIETLNRAYAVAERRPWWKRRLVAVVLTMALSLFVVLSVGLMLIGPNVASRAAGWLGLSPLVALVWRVARWPVMLGCAVLGIDLVYHFAPNRAARWVWVTPGALLSTALWIVGSFGFRLYVANFGHYTVTYGAIGGAIVTMLWFYVSGAAILIGAEMNAAIEEAWRSGRSDAPSSRSTAH